MKGRPRSECYAEVIERVCAACEGTFEVAASDVVGAQRQDRDGHFRFCSRDCYFNSMGYPIIDGRKWCPGCERNVEQSLFGRAKAAKNGLRRRCRDCEARLRREEYQQSKRYGGLNLVSATCKQCGEPVYHTKGRVREFCSTRCAAKGRPRAQSVAHLVVACETCGRDMDLYPSKGGQRFCGLKCVRQSVAPSGLELKAQAWLLGWGVSFQPEARLGRRYAADLLLPDRRLVIELNGCYWHACERCTDDDERARGVRAKDARKMEWLAAHGYRVLVIWGHQFRDGGAETIIREAVGVI